jgi:hypothetical protein
MIMGWPPRTAGQLSHTVIKLPSQTRAVAPGKFSLDMGDEAGQG